jgi:GT2 family glycosyltransferase
VSVPFVSIAIVTFNSAAYIRRCLEFALAQDYPALEVIVIDNNSSDDTQAALAEFGPRVRAVYNRGNVGFAAGQNRAIALSSSEWVLTLNPDVRLKPDFVSKAIAAAGSDPNVGTVAGKLLAMGPDFEIPERPVFDSTGIYFTPNLRHFDRGSRMPDDGRYGRPEYVFGATGAAALYRRRMIEDISIGGEFFDEDFFAYREDADVAWRAQLLGWKCLYTPEAVAYHVRRVLPSNRRSLPAAINMHSVKNRWLMRIKNMTGDLYRRHWLAITVRDCAVIGGCLLFEFRSLRAFAVVMRNWRKTWAKRREIMRRRRIADADIARWFATEPRPEGAETSHFAQNL